LEGVKAGKSHVHYTSSVWDAVQVLFVRVHLLQRHVSHEPAARFCTYQSPAPGRHSEQVSDLVCVVCIRLVCYVCACLASLAFLRRSLSSPPELVSKLLDPWEQQSCASSRRVTTIVNEVVGEMRSAQKKVVVLGGAPAGSRALAVGEPQYAPRNTTGSLVLRLSRVFMTWHDSLLLLLLR